MARQAPARRRPSGLARSHVGFAMPMSSTAAAIAAYRLRQQRASWRVFTSVGGRGISVIVQPASGRGPVRSLVGESVSLSLQGLGIIKRNDYYASMGPSLRHLRGVVKQKYCRVATTGVVRTCQAGDGAHRCLHRRVQSLRCHR